MKEKQSVKSNKKLRQAPVFLKMLCTSTTRYQNAKGRPCAQITQIILSLFCSTKLSETKNGAE